MVKGIPWVTDGAGHVPRNRTSTCVCQPPIQRPPNPHFGHQNPIALMENPSIPIYIYPHLVNMGTDEVPRRWLRHRVFLHENHYALHYGSALMLNLKAALNHYFRPFVNKND